MIFAKFDKKMINLFLMMNITDIKFFPQPARGTEKQDFCSFLAVKREKMEWGYGLEGRKVI